jgi:hypothetical protein
LKSLHHRDETLIFIALAYMSIFEAILVQTLPQITKGRVIVIGIENNFHHFYKMFFNFIFNLLLSPRVYKYFYHHIITQRLIVFET